MSDVGEPGKTPLDGCKVRSTFYRPSVSGNGRASLRKMRSVRKGLAAGSRQALDALNGNIIDVDDDVR